MKKVVAIFFVICIPVTILVDNSYGIPLFARKYNTTCFTCHVTEPLLNDFGERFRSNGLEMPSARSDITPLQDMGTLPIALLVQPMVAHIRQTDNIYSRTTTQTSVKALGLDLFSTSSLGTHLSYFTEVGVELEGDEASIGLGMMYLLYTDVLGNGSGNLNFRLGKMHVSLPFSHSSFLSNTDPLIYADEPFIQTVAPTNDLHVAHSLFGAAAYGIFPEISEGLHWEVAFTGGTKNEVDFRDARAVFGSLNQAIDLAGMRVEAGAFYFGGQQSVTTEVYQTYSKKNNHFRTGLGLEFFDPWTNRLHFYGQYIIGEDDNIDYWGLKRKVRGGFAGLHATIQAEKLFAFGRYDFLDSEDLYESSATQIDLGLRYHLLSNVVITGGFILKNAEGGNEISNDGGSHSHSIVPANMPAAPLDLATGSGIIVTPSDRTTTSFYLGILLGY